MKKVILILIILILAGGFFTFYRNSSKTNPFQCKDCNVIMISLSNVSADHMSLYGYERVTTPNLDKWAESATVFDNAFTQTSWTLPVATSLFTSLYPYTHGVEDRIVNNVLDKNIKTLPEILKAQGYKTAAFTGGFDYSNKFAHMRGFEDFGEGSDSTLSGFKYSVDKANEWLSKNSNSKFFLFLHGYDAHCPFSPAQKFKNVFAKNPGNPLLDSDVCLRGYENSDSGNYEVSYYKNGVQTVNLTQNDINYLEGQYDETILSVDEQIGNFLNGLDKKVLDKTIIIILSDHGEMFAKHGRFGRAGNIRGTLYDDVIHIPLIMKMPGQNGIKVQGLTQIIDVMPTVLSELGLSLPQNIQGKSLMPLVKGQKSEINDYIFTGSIFGKGRNLYLQETYPFETINEAVRSKDWKLIHEVQVGEGNTLNNETFELYNLKNDPNELNNIVNINISEASKLKKILKDWADQTRSSRVQNTTQPQLLPPELIQSGKEHGYF